MKYFKRLKLYKANNVTFDPTTTEAYSYRWWCFVKVINGKVIFNNYYYSPSTCKHQNKVWHLLRALNIKIDCTAKFPNGISPVNYEDAIKLAYREQNYTVASNLENIFKIKLTQKQIQAVYTDQEEVLCNKYLVRALKYQEKKMQLDYEKELAKQVANINETPKLNLVSL